MTAPRKALFTKLVARQIGPLSLSSPVVHLFPVLASERVDANLPCPLGVYSLYSKDMFQEKLSTDMPVFISGDYYP